MITWLNFGLLIITSFIFSFIYIPVWYYMCVAEERDLLIRYGEAYEKYCNNTGMWFPKIGN